MLDLALNSAAVISLYFAVGWCLKHKTAKDIDEASLYEYMAVRLTLANAKNDPEIIDEVARLLITVKSGWDALLLPGGHSPDYLRGDNRFVTFTRDFVNSGKPVFAICHGPQLLISADVIRGRKLTAVKPIIIDVKNAGAEFYDQEVVVDKDQLVTSRTPDDLPAFNREALRLLGA